uniref:TIL domain-containing protein n=1 Tax=Anopheles culicifacies TaxID=139723 RepID=A0A182M907_9DIPT
MKSFRALLMFAILAITMADMRFVPEECGPNEYFSDCGGKEMSCLTHEFSLPTDFCEPGCYCIDGRDDCGPNEYYTDCGPNNELHCQNRDMKVETEYCEIGCFCIASFVREDEDGTCIAESDCSEIER